MNKISLSPKARKIVLFSGMAVACVCILSVVLFKANAGTNSIATSASSSDAKLVLSSSGAVSVNPITEVDSAASSTGDGGTFNPQTEKNVSQPLTTVSKPSSAPPKPTVQGDSKNGAQPTNSALTNKNKKPTYTTKPQAQSTSSTSSKNSSTSSTSNGTSSKSSGGSTVSSGGSHAGEFYDPVFGWTKSTGGTGTKVSGDGDINKQVGTMD